LAYKIEVSKKAAKYIGRLGTPDRARFISLFKEIAVDPLGQSDPLVNSNPPARKSRVGGWRVIFIIDQPNQTVFISDVGPRGQIYNRV